MLLLENIRSILNVGSIFRTADAVGVEEILLVGYTPSPIDRMGRKNEKLTKTALGAEQAVRWKQYKTVTEALRERNNHTPIIVEQTDRAIPYTELSVTNPIFIFGNETEGVTQETRDAVTQHIFLPMRGKKESLNVAVCAAVILYHFSEL